MVSFALALDRVNVVAVTTILVLHADVIGQHVPRKSCFMFPRRTITARWVWGAFAPPKGQESLGEAPGPPIPKSKKFRGAPMCP